MITIHVSYLFLLEPSRPPSPSLVTFSTLTGLVICNIRSPLRFEGRLDLPLLDVGLGSGWQSKIST